MQKRVIEGLVLGVVFFAAIIAFWIIIDEPVGKAGMHPPKEFPGPTFPTFNSIPEATSTTTQSPSPAPYEEPSPPPFTYELIEEDICSKLKSTLKDALTTKSQGFKPYCTGRYDLETKEWSFMVGFTYFFPN